MLKRFIKNVFSCRHKNALMGTNEGFCPDCGKYLKKRYYVVRCADCDVKRVARKKFNEITPVDKFCTCCGSSDFVIEKYENLNFVDINYAIEIKEVIEDNSAINELEIWIDNKEIKNKPKENQNAPLISEMKYLGTL